MSDLAHLQVPPDSNNHKDTASAIPAKPPGVITFPIASFDEAYPPDPFGEEASEHARVWKVYRDQATEHDKKQLDGWNKTLDILLIFAGLYSAVLTAFLIESYHMLTEDSTDYMAKLLFQVVSANNGSLSLPILQPMAGPIQPPGTNFTLTSTALWVNGLWFSSLALTLSVALLCILAKEWLTEYEGVVFARAPTAHYWTRRRVLHHKGLKKWGVPFLISSLPSLLHVALFLFIVGLDLFLLPLDHGIAIAVGAIGGIVLVFYLLHFIIPIWNTSCAFRSPLARHIRRASVVLWYIALVVGTALREWYRRMRKAHPVYKLRLSDLWEAWNSALVAFKTPLPRIRTREERRIEAWSGRLDARALHWLLSSSTRSVASAAMQAIGSLRPVSDTAEWLHDLGVQDEIDGYMATRTLELTDASILHNDAALVEHMHCLRAMLSVARGTPIKGATPFTEPQLGLQNHDAQLLNHFVYILRSSTATTSTPNVEIDSMLLRALEHHNSEARYSSMPTQSTCHPSTFFMLFDILQIRLARVHGIDTILEEELEVIGTATPDRRRKSRAVAIHCAMVVHLVHALSPSNLDHAEALTVSMYLARCSDALSRTTRVLMFPGITLFPPRHFETESRFILFTTWICLAAHSKHLLFSSDTERVLARDIAAMAATFAPAFNDQNHISPITSHPYWTYVSNVAALNLPWTPSDLDSLIALYRHRCGNLDIEEPRTRRPLALLINHASSFEPDILHVSGPFVAFFCYEGTPAFSQRDFNNTIDDISYFLISHENRPSAWETLHSVICANRTANTYVVQLAISLASAIRARLLSRPTAGIRDDIIRFFGTRILGVCVSRLCADFLALASNTEASQLALEGRLQVAANFLADCAFICPQRTAEQIWSLISESVSSRNGTNNTTTSTMLVTYLGWVKEYDPRQAQVTTMRLFFNSPELDGVTRLSKLTAPLCGSTTADIPRAFLEAAVQWDFWSACDLVQHQDILATSRLLAHRILISQSDATVRVPATLLSVMAELVAQEASVPEHGSIDLSSQGNIVGYVSGLGEHRRFIFEEVQGPQTVCISAALLDMQSLAEMYAV